MTEPKNEEQLRADLASLRIERAALPRRRRRGGRGRAVLLLIAILALAAFVWSLTRGATPVVVAQATKAAPSEVGPAPVLSGSGYIVTGERYISLGVRVPGRIDRYFVEEGQSVRAGDPLVRLDDRDYRAAVARTEAGIEVAKANLDLAEAELRRGRELRRTSVISEQELDVLENKAEVARATLKQLDAALAEAKVNLEYTLLRAPTDGVVLAKLKEVGEIAVPGGFAGSGDLIRLANLNDMRAEVDVNEADLQRVRLGQTARVTPDAYPTAGYEASVVKLYPQVDRQKGTLKVEVKILDPDDRLLPDMSARVTFFAEADAGGAPAAEVVLVPAAALHRDSRGDSFVWLVEGGRARRVRVETAGDAGDRARIASGLAGGETVVVGEAPARDGERVRVVQ